MPGKKYKDISRLKGSAVLSLSIFITVAVAEDGRERERAREVLLRRWSSVAGLTLGTGCLVWVPCPAALMIQAGWPRREMF